MSLLAAALARAHDFLLAPEGEVLTAPSVAATVRSLEIAVVGLKAECGASTVAAGLARALSSAGVLHAHVTEVAPAELAGHCPDLTVLVVPGDVEPALVSIVTGIVGARLGRIVVVANRVRDRDRWIGRSSLCVPDSRIGAVLAGHGRISPGQLGAAYARLAEIVVEAEDRDALR